MSETTFLIPEDGSGVMGANAYCSQAFADAYCAARAGADTSFSAWSGYTDAQKQSAIILATDYLDATQSWIGNKNSYSQGLQWPRTGAFDQAGMIDIPTTVVPPVLMMACADLAARAASGTTLLQDLERGGMIKSQSVAGLSITYMDGAPAGTVYGAVSMVAGLTRDANSLPPIGVGITTYGSPGLTQGKFDIGGLNEDIAFNPPLTGGFYDD